MVGTSMSFPALPQRLHSPTPGYKLLSPVGPTCNTSSLPLLQDRGDPPLHLLPLLQREHNVWELWEPRNGLFWAFAGTATKNQELEFFSLKY